MSHLPTKPPRREPMSESERLLRDKLIARWAQRHAEWPTRETWPDLGAGEGGTSYTYWRHRPRADRWVYTTARMFDGKFWSFRYRWNATRGMYVLVKGSIRRHAKRKDAKERSLRAARSA